MGWKSRCSHGGQPLELMRLKRGCNAILHSTLALLKIYELKNCFSISRFANADPALIVNRGQQLYIFLQINGLFVLLNTCIKNMDWAHTGAIK